MDCRICKNVGINKVGSFRAYLDYAVEIFDCPKCGCRLSPRDETIYEKLHSSPASTYGTHNGLAQAVKRNFDERDVDSLEATLCQRKKNRFIIDAGKRLNLNAKVLEVGCSLGYLTSWFIAKGFDVTGIDVSRTAIDKASALFGEHFELVSDKKIEDQAPYDLICHAGTIGCVDDPIGLTRYWLSLLKPGGQLVFNAPNKALADRLNKLWPHGTPPPDLVTLFPTDFWSSQFTDVAVVTIEENYLTNREALMLRILPRLVMCCHPYLFKNGRVIRFLYRAIKYVIRKLSVLISDNSVSTFPAEFGVMVILTKDNNH